MQDVEAFEALKLIKQIFDEHNEAMNENTVEETKEIINESYRAVRPLICICSDIETELFSHFYTDKELPELFLSKPLDHEELYSLLKLAQVL